MCFIKKIHIFSRFDQGHVLERLVFFFFRWVVGSLAPSVQEPDQISFNAALDACCKGQAMVNSAAGGGLEQICWVFPGGTKRGVRGNGNMQLRTWLSILNSYLLMALNLAPSNSQISSDPPRECRTCWSYIGGRMTSDCQLDT